MARIEEIAGIGIRANTIPQNGLVVDSGLEQKQRGQNVEPMSYLNTSWLSVDEARVQLFGEQYRILYQYTGNPVYLKGYNMAKDALYKGLHTARGLAYFGTSFDPILGKIAAAITKGSKNPSPRPAAKSLSFKEKGRTKLNGVDVPYYSKAGARNVMAQIGEIAPLLDCEKYNPFTYDYLTFEEWKNDPTQSSATVAHTTTNYNNFYRQPLAVFLEKKWNDCKNENWWRETLNDKLEGVAHHPLYMHIKNSQAYRLSVLGQGKPVLHKAANGSLSALSGIDYWLLRDWFDTAIMQRNSTKGAGPRNGRESIDVMIQGADNKANGIGEPITVGTIVAIIGALASAAGAAAALIVAINSNSTENATFLKQQTGGFDIPGWGGALEDFLGKIFDPNDDGTISFTEWLPLVALGLGGYFLLNDKQA